MSEAPFDIASPDAIDSPSDHDPEGGDAAADDIAIDTASTPTPKQTQFKATPTASDAAMSDLVGSPPDEEEEAEAAPADAGDFTPEIIEKAKGYGIDEATAKRFGTTDALELALANQDRVAAEWGQRQLAALQGQQQAPPAAPQIPQAPAAVAPPTPQAQQQVAQQILAGYKVDRDKLLDEGFDTSTIDLLEGMAGHFNSQLDKAGSYISGLAQQQLALQNTGPSPADEEAQLVQGVEGYFNNLGPEWEPVFGKGASMALDPNSPAMAERRKLYNTVCGLKFADAQQNQQRPLPELLEGAVNALHFSKKQELASKQLAAKVQQRRGQALPRAGAQRGTPMSGEEKAINRVQSFYRKHRISSV